MVFDKGDIVRVRLNPTEGKETQGDFRPCLVLSPKVFNRLGMTVIAPISQGGNFARIQGFCVSLSGSGTKTQGVVMVNGVRTLDLSARGAKKEETVPQFIVDEAIAVFESILDGR